MGVRETNGHFSIEGLTDSQLDRYQRDFWNTLNNKNKVSSNILLNHHVAVMETEGKKILRIDVPPARREDEPVYIGPDPMKGTIYAPLMRSAACSQTARTRQGT